MIELQTDETDAPAFVEIVTQLIRGAVETSEPDAVVVVKVDGWFGPEELGSEPAASGDFGTPTKDLALPPFEPARVVEERILEKKRSGFWAQVEAEPLHGSSPGAAEAALKLAEIHPAAAFAWWSGGTKTTGRGSVLICLPTEEGHLPWYGELLESRGWVPGPVEAE